MAGAKLDWYINSGKRSHGKVKMLVLMRQNLFRGLICIAVANHPWILRPTGGGGSRVERAPDGSERPSIGVKGHAEEKSAHEGGGPHRGELWAWSPTFNKKLCYREEHSASVVLSWCTLWHLSADKQQSNSWSTTCTKLSMKPTDFREITQNNGHAVQGHSRSPILVPIESPYTTSY